MAKSPLLIALGLSVLPLYLVGGNELLLLPASALLPATIELGLGRQGGTAALAAGFPQCLLAASDAAPVDLGRVFPLFLKFVSVVFAAGTYGSRSCAPISWRASEWLANEQLVDAATVGQMRPCPEFATATFSGYLVAGLPGALLAPLGMFLPSFVFRGAAQLANPPPPRRRWRA